MSDYTTSSSRPDLRGIGLGRRIVTSLMAWGRSEGAHSAYLQVREDNEVARSLYESLGFAETYRYVYRVMPRARLGVSVATSAPATMSAQASASVRVGSA